MIIFNNISYKFMEIRKYFARGVENHRPLTVCDNLQYKWLNYRQKELMSTMQNLKKMSLIDDV